MEAPKQDNVPVKAIVYTVGGLFAYFGVVRPLFKKLGIIETKEDKTIKAGEKIKAFSRTFYKEVSAKKIPATYFTSASALSNATILYNSMFSNLGWGTDESAIYAVFKNVKSQVQISQLSDVYATKYKADLYSDLVDEFSEDEMIRLLDIIKKIPVYK